MKEWIKKFCFVVVVIFVLVYALYGFCLFIDSIPGIEINTTNK